MEDWRKGGVLGSLRKRVAWELKEHRRTNTALKSARAPFRMRVLQAFLGKRGLLGFLALYALFLIFLIVIELVIAYLCPSLIPGWTNAQNIGPHLKDVTSYFLGAQVTMIGLLFPIAVGLVTLIVQREDASSTSSDVQVYYSQTLAYQVGASGIALSIVLATQLLWPMQFAVHRFGFGTTSQGIKVVLTSFHLAWLILNFAALWHFLDTSLSFIRPAKRGLMRRCFAANVSIPNDLSARLALYLYTNARASLLQRADVGTGDNDPPSILFGSELGEWGEIEIAEPKSSRKVLRDVWMKPLGWAVRRWWNKCVEHASGNMPHGSTPTLVFTPDLRRPLPEGGIICRRRNGVPLSFIERFVIKRCFRFGRERS